MHDENKERGKSENIYSLSLDLFLWVIFTDCTMGFITMKKHTIWENMFGSVFSKHCASKSKL